MMPMHEACPDEPEGAGSDPACWAKVTELIHAARTIAISGHTNPDGDAIGSALALGLALRGTYPEKDVTFLLADDAPVPRVYRFLPSSDEMVPAVRYEETPDLFVSVDAPTLERLHDSAAVARRAGSTIVIDHHPAREEFADAVVRRPELAAAAMLVCDLMHVEHMEMTPDIANCLFTGLATDTGRFQYQNADAAAFMCAALLVRDGASPALVAHEVYQSQRLEYLRLEALVIERITVVGNGLVAYSYATNEDLARFGVDHDECDGLIDLVREVAGVELCLFCKEARTPGIVRGSLRAKDGHDVSRVAARFGGGGHAAAAGFSFHGTVREALDAVVPELVELADEDLA